MTHVFKSPKFFKELRASLRKAAISPDMSTDIEGRTPRVAPTGITMISCKDPKPQASSSKESQASSNKPQAPSTLEQASSHKRQAP